MQLQWNFEGCANTTKEKCRTYWDKKQERLERILSSIPLGSKKLRIAVFNHRDKVGQFEARSVLNLPGRSLAVQFSHADLFAVLDGLSDKLVAAAKKFKERSSRVVRESRKQQISEDLFAAESLLAWDVKAERKKSFFTILRPLLDY
jgi:ribosome-associated translation inhibitor RaiA